MSMMQSRTHSDRAAGGRGPGRPPARKPSPVPQWHRPGAALRRDVGDRGPRGGLADTRPSKPPARTSTTSRERSRPTRVWSCKSAPGMLPCG